MSKKKEATEGTEITEQPVMQQISRDEQFALEAVKAFQIAKPGAGAQELHEEWRWAMLACGWNVGIERDVIEKTHPRLVAYHALDQAAQEAEAKEFGL